MTIRGCTCNLSSCLKWQSAKTPQSCIDLFQLDNQMFVRVGQAISSGDPTEYTATTVYIKGVTDKRMLLADSCIAGRYN